MRRIPVGATAAIAVAGGYAALYRLGQTWGATRQERRRALAGDELLPDARAFTTHAITIAAPARHVWPWLVQMGWGRAGWYTYRWVERTPVPGQRPRRRPHPPRASAARAGRPGPRRPTRGGLLVHRGAARAGPAAGAAVDPAPAAVVAATGTGDGLDLELAAGRADPWVDAGGAAQPDVPAPLVVRASVPGRDRPGGPCHGPQPPARPAATGRSCPTPGDARCLVG
jgi:hypothetical protein